MFHLIIVLLPLISGDSEVPVGFPWDSLVDELDSLLDSGPQQLPGLRFTQWLQRHPSSGTADRGCTRGTLAHWDLGGTRLSRRANTFIYKYICKNI